MILRKYGDYLHRKGDYDTAMQQYLKAIDSTEPSQVIRKFLDSQRINNLIEYLEELHDHDKATVDHTTLLLNCYAKLKDLEKLETFIKSGTHFDLETAISMCRQGGYYDQAVFLAKKNEEHELVIDIMVENLRQYEDALDYIWHLDAGLAYPNLMKYARILLEHCPEGTTQLFVDYYTGLYKPKQDVEQPEAQESNPQSNRATFLSLPYRQGTPTVSTDQAHLPKPDATALESATTEPVPQYDTPRPRTAFSSFVDHPDCFIMFLEACLMKDGLDREDRVDLHTTLFEIYLETAAFRKGEEKLMWETKAKKLIEGKDVRPDCFCTYAALTSPRYPSICLTSSCCLTFPTSTKAQRWPRNTKDSASTSSAPTLRRKTQQAPLKRSESMVQKSHSSIQSLSPISPLHHKHWKKLGTSLMRS